MDALDQERESIEFAPVRTTGLSPTAAAAFQTAMAFEPAEAPRFAHKLMTAVYGS